MSIGLIVGSGQTGTCPINLYEDLHGSYPAQSGLGIGTRVVRVIRCELTTGHAGNTHQRTMQDGVVVVWTSS